MTKTTLYIGNKNYSSWSMRPWLALKKAGVSFDEELIPLDTPTMKAELAALSPSRTVPVLKHGEHLIWDSLAIAEWAADKAPAGVLWPEDANTRALARADGCMMHAGFAALRRDAPMNLKRKTTPDRLSEEAMDDAKRAQGLWTMRLEASGGPFLHGAWSIADAFYAPLATRFETYGVPVSATVRAYMDALFADPDFQAWKVAGLDEPWVMNDTDNI